jgi:EAL and modified HD-GYP domain-containing signal transduction protein
MSTSAPPSPSALRSACVSRQPILDASGRVFGYELLHRDPDGSVADGARGLTDVVLDVGLDTLAESKPAFLNFSRDLLVSHAGSLLPAKKVVIQLRRGIAVDDEVVEACAALHESGYRLAIDFVSDPEAERLLPYMSYVKIDVRRVSMGAASALAKRFAAEHVRAIAEKVETKVACDAAKASGFSLFQGFYFCRPTTTQATALPSRRLAYLQLLAALRQPDVGVRQIEELVKHDVSLSYRVLKCVNSAAYGLRSEVTSIRQALIMIGIEPIRKWVSVWSVAGLNTEGPSEIVTVSLLRARCCELLGQRLGGGAADSELFLLGLCSLLDAVLDRPLADAIADLPLGTEIRGALLGEANTPRAVLDVVIAYEAGNWDEALDLARRLGLPEEAPSQVYSDALSWARELSRAAA